MIISRRNYERLLEQSLDAMCNSGELRSNNYKLLFKYQSFLMELQNKISGNPKKYIVNNEVKLRHIDYQHLMTLASYSNKR